MSDLRVRRELMRWHLLLALDKARPSELVEAVVQATMRDLYPDVTEIEVRRELGYLEDRSLVRINRTPNGVWWSTLTRLGVDIVEYTVECQPGIGRPAKYW